MKPLRFELVLAVAAAVVGVLLWYLGYWVIAFAGGIAVFAIGSAVYFATRAGSHTPHAPHMS